MQEVAQTELQPGVEYYIDRNPPLGKNSNFNFARRKIGVFTNNEVNTHYGSIKSFFTNARFVNPQVQNEVQQNDSPLDMTFENSPQQNYTYHFYRVQTPSIKNRVTNDVLTNVIGNNVGYGGKKSRKSRKIVKSKKSKKSKKRKVKFFKIK